MCKHFLINFTKKISLLSTFFILFFIISVISFAQDGKEMFRVCAACHTIGGGKLIGPDLYGVNDRHDEAWMIRFIQNSQEVIASGDTTAIRLFEQYNKVIMPPNNLTDDQVRTLLAYIKNYDPNAEQASVTETKSTSVDAMDEEIIEAEYVRKADKRNYGTTFIFALIFLLFAIADLIFIHFIKAKFVNYIIILITLVIMVEIIVIEAQGLGRQQYYEPVQPIAFSHKIHALQNKIDCQYCHSTINVSNHAGIPSTQLCMNCHNVVRSGRKTGTEEIAKIYASLESMSPIRWVKVHNLPDHVYFNHAQHFNIGGVECTECHGPVETMDRIIQVNDLSMGWCIKCHRTKAVNFSNEFYRQYTKLNYQVDSGYVNKATVQSIGGDECQKCHY